MHSSRRHAVRESKVVRPAVFPWWNGPDCHDDRVTTAATPKGERRRQALVESAAELILEGGIDAVRHRAVANRAGLPLASTTYYFESLDELVVCAFEYNSSRELDLMRARVEEVTPPSTAVWSRPRS